MIKNILAAALIVGVSAAASAQTTSDSTQRESPSQTQQQPSNQFNSRDYTQVQSSDVPASLRTTLQGDSYSGWEKGKLYRKNNGDGYYLSTGTGTNSKNYYFDNNGKALLRQGASGSESGQPATGGSTQPSGGTPEKP